MNVKADMRRLLQNMQAHPEYIIADLKQTYPGITDGEASALASLFTGLFDGSTNGKAWQQRAQKYSAAVEAMAKKYPGGVEDIDLGFDLDFDL